MNTTKDKIENLNDDTLASLEEKVERIVAKYLNDAKESAKAAKDNMVDLKDKAADYVVDTYSSAKNKTEKLVKRNPFETIGITFLTGLAVGWLLKS